jgi:hypothetical protein
MTATPPPRFNPPYPPTPQPYRGHPVQHPGHPGQPYPRRPRRTKVIAIAAAAAAGLMAIAIAVSLSSESTTTSSRNSSPTTSEVAPSSSDDWYRAVCRTGTFDNGQGGLRNADRGVAFCVSPVSGTTISIGQYTSEFMARDEAAGPGVKSYALARTSSGDWQLFISYTDGTGAALAPLAKFGFTVTPSSP